MAWITCKWCKGDGKGTIPLSKCSGCQGKGAMENICQCPICKGGPNEGRKDDSGKADWTLLPLPALQEVLAVLTFGASKYGPENWRKVERSRYVKALWRHWVAYLQDPGAKDPDTGQSHLAHLICCALFLLELDRKP